MRRGIDTEQSLCIFSFVQVIVFQGTFKSNATGLGYLSGKTFHLSSKRLHQFMYASDQAGTGQSKGTDRAKALSGGMNWVAAPGETGSRFPVPPLSLCVSAHFNAILTQFSITSGS